MTVKLKEDLSRKVLENVLKNTGIKIVRENQLGYVDLDLSESKKFYEWHDHLTKMGIFETAEMNSFGELFTNDPYLTQQYYLYSNSYPNIILNNYYWGIEDGSSNPIIVAIIDLGVDFSHSDLNYNLNNKGWDYIEGNSDPSPIYVDHHGTGIAGIIGAIRNNNEFISGIAGVDYNENMEANGIKIMALRIGRSIYLDGRWKVSINSEVIDDAIIYAKNHGAKIMNFSFGASQSSSIDAAIELAYKNNCIMIASNHNGYVDKATGITYPEIAAPLPYPARHAKVLAVGGIKKDYTAHSKTSDIDPDLCAPSKEIVSLKNNNSVNEVGYSGCSFAAPQVAGAAALLYSYDSNLIYYDIKSLLINHCSRHEISDWISNGHGQGYIRVGPALDQLFYGEAYDERPQNLNIQTYASKPKLIWTGVDNPEKFKVYRAGY